jgi:putative ABC transport system permease protein
MIVITAMLIVLAVINALLTTWATIADNRHATALAQALGATPDQVAAGIAATQLFAVVPGTLAGIPLGIALLQTVAKSSDAYKLIPIWWYPAIFVCAAVFITALGTIPARIAGRRPIAPTLETT